MSTEEHRERHGGQLGALLLATVFGVGVGLLAAPQAGSATRRALRKRLAAVGEDFEDEFEELRERGGKASRTMREGAERLHRRGRKVYEDAVDELRELREQLEDRGEEDEGSGAVGTLLAMGAGLAAAYLMTSERAAPARKKVREAARGFRDEAEARWDRFQHRGGNGQPIAESGTRTDPADTTPQTS